MISIRDEDKQKLIDARRVIDDVLTSINELSQLDLEMLVDMGILFSYMDHFHGQRMYRLRRVRTTKGTKMIYSQRVQYAKGFYKNHKVAA